MVERMKICGSSAKLVNRLTGVMYSYQKGVSILQSDSAVKKTSLRKKREFTVIGLSHEVKREERIGGS